MAATITGGPVVMKISDTPTTRVSVTTVTGDASYPTGGYAVSAAQLGLATVGVAIATAGIVEAAANTAVQWVYNTATNKLQGFTATAEVANTTVLTNQQVQVLAFGN